MNNQPLPRSPWRQRILILYLIGLGLLLPVFLFFSLPRFSLLARVVGWVGFGVGILPSLVMLLRPKSRMNGIAVAGLAVSMYQLAVFHEQRLLLRWGEARITEASVDLAMLLIALVVPCMWAGWALIGYFNLGQVLPRPRLNVPIQRVRRVGIAIVLSSLVLDVLFARGDLAPASVQLRGLITVLTPSELGFAMILVAHYEENKEGRPWIFFALWGSYLLSGLVAGALLIVLKPMALYLLAELFLRRRLQWTPAVVGVMILLLAQPVKGNYRQKVWDRQGPVEIGFFDRALLFGELMVQHWLPGEYGTALDTETSIGIAASRTGSALGLAHVIEMTPGAVPYQYGGTLRYLQYAWIPRLFYPDKPTAQVADIWYSATYGYLKTQQQAHVMVGMPQISECYINFGFLGALLMLFGIGTLYRAVDEIFGQDRAGSGGASIYLAYATNQLINFHEGSLAQAWGGLVQYLLIYTALMLFLKKVPQKVGP